MNILGREDAPSTTRYPSFPISGGVASTASCKTTMFRRPTRSRLSYRVASSGMIPGTSPRQAATMTSLPCMNKMTTTFFLGLMASSLLRVLLQLRPLPHSLRLLMPMATSTCRRCPLTETLTCGSVAAHLLSYRQCSRSSHRPLGQAGWPRRRQEPHACSGPRHRAKPEGDAKGPR